MQQTSLRQCGCNRGHHAICKSPPSVDPSSIRLTSVHRPRAFALHIVVCLVALWICVQCVHMCVCLS